MQENPEQFASMSVGLCPLFMDPVLMDVEGHSADVFATDPEESAGSAEISAEGADPSGESAE